MRTYAYRPFCSRSKKVQTGLDPAIFCVLLDFLEFAIFCILLEGTNPTPRGTAHTFHNLAVFKQKLDKNYTKG